MEHKINYHNSEQRYANDSGSVISFGGVVSEVIKEMLTKKTSLKFLKLSNDTIIGKLKHYSNNEFLKEVDEHLKRGISEGKVLIASLVRGDNHSKVIQSKLISLGGKSPQDSENLYASNINYLFKISRRRKDSVYKFSIADAEEVSINLDELVSKTETFANKLINSLGSKDIYLTLTKTYVGLSPYEMYQIIDLRASAVIAFNHSESMLACISYKNNSTGKLEEYSDILGGKHPEKSILVRYVSPDYKHSVTTILTSKNNYYSDEIFDIGNSKVVNVFETFNLNKHLPLKDANSLNPEFGELCNYIKTALKFESSLTATNISHDPLA